MIGQNERWIQISEIINYSGILIQMPTDTFTQNIRFAETSFQGCDKSAFGESTVHSITVERDCPFNPYEEGTKLFKDHFPMVLFVTVGE